jgi:cell division protein FtsB
MREAPAPPRNPRPLVAFFVSLVISGAALAVLLFSDRQTLELKKSRAEIQELDRQIADRRRENERLKAAIDAANRHDFPAEKVAREELQLVRPDDVVLLFPEGSLSGTPAAAGPGKSSTPAPAPPTRTSSP